jgi:hypothetical protein
MVVRMLPILVAFATPVLAATDLEVFEKTVSKYAPVPTAPLSLKKNPCLCLGGAVNHGKAGVLMHSTSVGAVTQVNVSCAVPSFDNATGAMTTALQCSVFEVLGK